MPTPSHARVAALRVALGLALGVLACARPPASTTTPSGPTRLAILDPDYGRSLAHPDATPLGARIDALALPLADGGVFELATALAAGRVVLVWIGGAEHEALSAWLRGLDHELAAFEQRAATLVFVRPLAPEAALRWAAELHLQTPVAGDPDGALTERLDARTEPLEFAVWIVEDGILRYRKLGSRRPELAELLAVLDGEAERLRCCPGACVGSACE